MGTPLPSTIAADLESNCTLAPMIAGAGRRIGMAGTAANRCEVVVALIVRHRSPSIGGRHVQADEFDGGADGKPESSQQITLQAQWLR